MRKKIVRASIRGEGRSGWGAVTAIPQPTVTAAALPPPPATAAVFLPPPPLPPQHLPAVLLVPPLLEGRGGVAALPLTRLGGAVAATARTGIAVTAVRRSGTGGGAVLIDQAATRKNAVIPGNAGAGGVDPEKETGAELGPGTATVAAERGKRRRKGIRRGKGAGRAEIAVAVVAANTNRRPPAKMSRGGEKGVTAMRKTRKRRIRIGRKSLIKGKKNQKPKRRKREAL